tara:strand:- start:265 stop:1026 length:762 start_codon:yes stop_codon:yes gene_type:complete
MIGQSILKFPPLHQGILIKRYKRFLADIELSDGHLVTAHCANTGPMKGVLSPGAEVRLKYCPSPKRKLDWSWEQIKVTSSCKDSYCWVGVNTALPNKIVRSAIELGYLESHLGKIASVRSEVPYGYERKSRIDLLLQPAETNADPRSIYIEVKNTTWTKGSLALFPDTVTTRGQKHLKELMSIMPNSKAVLVPSLSRSDVHSFAPGDSADNYYGDLFRLALAQGLEVIPCCFGFHLDEITWEGTRPFQKKEKL